MSILQADIPEAGYGKKVVLKNISLGLKRGEIVALIGPNGAGKSTFLKVLVGLLKIPKGSVSTNGLAITNRDPEENVKDGILFVPQGNRVFTELTVMENLEIGGYLIKDRKQLSVQVSKVLELFPDLEQRFNEDAGKLSGGEKQQLALARALMLNPKILLLDEPSLGLSPKLVAKAFDTIRGINENFKTTILIVEQKVHEVLRVAQRVIALRMGEIVFEGSSQELQSGNKLKEIFLL